MINWLMQRTADGATYLQVIILTFALGWALWTFRKIWKDIAVNLWCDYEEDENDEH